MYTGGFCNVKQSASMSAIYVNNNIDAFTVLIRKNLGSFRKSILCGDNKLTSCIATSSVLLYSPRVTLPNDRIHCL